MTWINAHPYWFLAAFVAASIPVLAVLWRIGNLRVKRAIRDARYQGRLIDRSHRLMEDAVWYFRDEWAAKAKRINEARTGIPAWVTEAGIDLTRTYEDVA